MSDNESIEQESQEVKQPTGDDQTTIIVKLQEELEALRKHSKQLLAEKRATQEKARVAEEEKARKNGDFEQLLKSSEEQRNALASELESLRQNITKEKISHEAMKIATELADGPNAELLSEFIGRRLKHTEDGIKILDQSGNLTVSSVSDLKNELISSGKYNSLLRGTKAAGGGANGNTSSMANKPKTIDRKTFDSWSLDKQHSFILKDQGNVID